MFSKLNAMNEQKHTNYNQIAEVIGHIKNSFKERLNLDEISEKTNFSLFELDKLFIDWADVDLETFLKFINIKHVKQVLNNSPFLFSEKTKHPRLHIQMERMSSEESKNNRENGSINYSFAECFFGRIIIASTPKGICYMGFSDQNQIAFSELEKRFPKARFIEQVDAFQEDILKVFSEDWNKISKIKLHLKGTDFQFEVWNALLKIPMGSLTSYGNIAEMIQKPKAERAVGNAIGSNPIAFLIPCHRVVKSSGNLGGYMWGTVRKTAIIGWECVQIELAE